MSRRPGRRVPGSCASDGADTDTLTLTRCRGVAPAHGDRASLVFRGRERPLLTPQRAGRRRAAVPSHRKTRAVWTARVEAGDEPATPRVRATSHRRDGYSANGSALIGNVASWPGPES